MHRYCTQLIGLILLLIVAGCDAPREAGAENADSGNAKENAKLPDSVVTADQAKAFVDEFIKALDGNDRAQIRLLINYDDFAKRIMGLSTDAKVRIPDSMSSYAHTYSWEVVQQMVTARKQFEFDFFKLNEIDGNVTAIFREIDPFHMYFTYYEVILSRHGDEKIPRIADVVRSEDGEFFSRLKRRQIYIQMRSKELEKIIDQHGKLDEQSQFVADHREAVAKYIMSHAKGHFRRVIAIYRKADETFRSYSFLARKEFHANAMVNPKKLPEVYADFQQRFPKDLSIDHLAFRFLANAGHVEFADQVLTKMKDRLGDPQLKYAQINILLGQKKVDEALELIELAARETGNIAFIGKAILVSAYTEKHERTAKYLDEHWTQKKENVLRGIDKVFPRVPFTRSEQYKSWSKKIEEYEKKNSRKGLQLNF